MKRASITPLSSTLLKQNTDALIIPSIYNDKLVEEHFGTQFNFNREYCFLNFTTHYFETPLYLKANKSDTVRAFALQNGGLAVFTLPSGDVCLLNGLLYNILRYKPSYYSPNYIIDGATFFAKKDKNSRYFDNDHQVMYTLPVQAFNGRLCLKIVGVVYDQINGSSKLLITIHHIQVITVSKSDEEEEICCFSGQ